MKRDMDLIRFQLLRVEGEDPVPDLDKYTEEQQIEHMALCIEAGFVEGVIRRNSEGQPNGTVAIRLTWKGHEFLAIAKDDSVWKRACNTIKEVGGHAGSFLLEELLKKMGKEAIGLA